MSREKQLATIIRNSSTWIDCIEECRELCELAGLGDELDLADGETFESVMYKAADILEVEI